jgi:hypothetical protein
LVRSYGRRGETSHQTGRRGSGEKSNTERHNKRLVHVWTAVNRRAMPTAAACRTGAHSVDS